MVFIPPQRSLPGDDNHAACDLWSRCESLGQASIDWSASSAENGCLCLHLCLWLWMVYPEGSPKGRLASPATAHAQPTGRACVDLRDIGCGR